MRLPTTTEGSSPLTGWTDIEGRDDRIKMLLYDEGAWEKMVEEGIAVGGPMTHESAHRNQHPETRTPDERWPNRAWYEVDIKEWYYCCGDCL